MKFDFIEYCAITLIIFGVIAGIGSIIDNAWNQLIWQFIAIIWAFQYVLKTPKITAKTEKLTGVKLT